MTAAPTLAVTGSTGHLGGLVARQLADAGSPQRLLVRDAGRAPELEDAVPAVVTYADPVGAKAALEGVKTLFMVSPPRPRTGCSSTAPLWTRRPLPACSTSSTPHSSARQRIPPSRWAGTTSPPRSGSGPRGWTSPSCGTTSTWTSCRCWRARTVLSADRPATASWQPWPGRTSPGPPGPCSATRPACRPNLRPHRPGGPLPGPGRGTPHCRDRPDHHVPQRDARGGLRVAGLLWRPAVAGGRLGQHLHGDRRRRTRRADVGRARAHRPRTTGPGTIPGGIAHDLTARGRRPGGPVLTASGPRR